VLGLLVAGWAIRTMFRAGDSPDPERPVRVLVTNGPFAFTRNPIYLGFAFLYGGVAIFFDSPVTLLLLPVVLYVHTRVIIEREEAYLQNRFEADYSSYKGRVRRWL
jgi:protein-S-isoprenylcysteine O-methyltransferase Ste14